MKKSRAFALIAFGALAGLSALSPQDAPAGSITGASAVGPGVEIDPVSRSVRISYEAPAGAPEVIRVRCRWRDVRTGQSEPASITPYLSDTALALAPEADWVAWEQGEILERRAAGLKRSVVWDPYPSAQREGMVNVDFELKLETVEGAPLGQIRRRVRMDNRDVTYVEDWAQVLQRGMVARDREPALGEWSFRSGLPAASGASLGTALYGNPDPQQGLRALTYPLNLKGPHAIFLRFLPDAGVVRIRTTGEERADKVFAPREGVKTHSLPEVLWNWRTMDRQHLVIQPPHHYKGYDRACLDYVKLVPLQPDTVARLNRPLTLKRDRVVAGFFEPYSWSFYEDIRNGTQHREILSSLAEGGIQIADSQMGRIGMKVVFEARSTDQLLYNTIGDPTQDDPRPTTDHVGRMQQYTNTLETELRHAPSFGLKLHANFGASATYIGSPLQGDITKKNPTWVKGHDVRYELKEVRDYVVSLYREALEIGAHGISIDFCRYPECIDKPETSLAIMRELRSLSREFSRRRHTKVPVLIRFPAHGVRLSENFDYRTWVKEGLIDYLCPSNLQGRHMHFDIAPYVRATRGTSVKLLPVIDALEWAPPLPGPFLWRARQLYDAGVDGIYVYQADGRVNGGRPEDRRALRYLGSRAALNEFWKEDADSRPQRSKGIYIRPPSYPAQGYHVWERLRLWVEGVPMGAMELYLDGKQVNSFTAPPYLLGDEERSSDGLLTRGDHDLRVRVRDGTGWLEQSFRIRGGG